MSLVSVRRRVKVEAEHGGDFHQFVGYVDTADVALHPDMDDDTRARAIIEEAYEQSSLQQVRRMDDHELALIEKVKQVESEVLQGETANEEVEQ